MCQTDTDLDIGGVIITKKEMITAGKEHRVEPKADIYWRLVVYFFNTVLLEYRYTHLFV